MKTILTNKLTVRSVAVSSGIGLHETNSNARNFTVWVSFDNDRIYFYNHFRNNTVEGVRQGFYQYNTVIFNYTPVAYSLS